MFRTASHTTTLALTLGALLALDAGLSAASAKAYNLRKHNNASYGAACDKSPTCINWGGGVYTNGDSGVICTKTKCTLYTDEPD